MKKWMSILFVAFALAACSNEEAVNEPSAKQDKESVAVEKEDTKQLQAKEQLYNVLNTAVKEFGLPLHDANDFESHIDESGVFYAELTDFNNDGIDDLYVLLKNNGQITSQQENRNEAYFHEEVWIADVNADEAKLAHSSLISADICAVCDVSVSIIDAKDGGAFTKKVLHQTYDGNDFDYTTFMEFRDDLAITHILGEENEYGTPKYLINEKTVTKENYDVWLTKFVGNERKIVLSDGGFKTFGFTESSSDIVNGILQKLTPKETPKQADKEEASSESNDKTRELVLSAFDQQSPDVNIDIFDPERRSGLIFMAIIEGNLPSTIDPQTSASAYRYDDVAAAYKEKYGVELNLRGVIIPDRSRQMYEYMTFEDGVFYVTATDYYSEIIDRHFEDVKEVKKDVYYVTITDHHFDSEEYAMATGDMNSYRGTTYDQWPSAAQPYINANVKRYAVVKIVDGAPKLQYIKDESLTDEQLAKF